MGFFPSTPPPAVQIAAHRTQSSQSVSRLDATIRGGGFASAAADAELGVGLGRSAAVVAVVAGGPLPSRASSSRHCRRRALEGR